MTDDVVVDLSETDDEFATPAPVQPRDGRKRPLIVPPGGGKPVAYQRASTFASFLSDSAGLTTWKVRHAVHGVASNGALTARAAAANYGEGDLDAVIEDGLLLSGGSDAANYGTAFHRLTEPDARDRDPDTIPASIRADVASFWQAIDAAQLTIVATEEFVVNDAYGVAGTFDHIIELPDGLGRVVADKKTGRFKAKEVAVQLATYAGGVRYDAHGQDGPTRTPLDVRQDLALLIHSPHGAGTTELRWIRLDRGREAIEHALWLRAWRSADDIDIDFAAGLAELDRNVDEFHRGAPNASSSPTAAPDVPRSSPGEEEARTTHADRARAISRDGLEGLVAAAPSTQRIGELFEAHRDLWDEGIRDLARARRALLDGGVV